MYTLIWRVPAYTQMHMKINISVDFKSHRENRKPEEIHDKKTSRIFFRLSVCGSSGGFLSCTPCIIIRYEKNFFDPL